MSKQNGFNMLSELVARNQLIGRAKKFAPLSDQMTAEHYTGIAPDEGGMSSLS